MWEGGHAVYGKKLAARRSSLRGKAERGSGGNYMPPSLQSGHVNYHTQEIIV